MVSEFKIMFHSGVGDCLRLLSWHSSLEKYNEVYGLTLYWVYQKHDTSPMKDALLDLSICSLTNSIADISPHDIFKSITLHNSD